MHLLTWALLIVAAFTVNYSLQGWKRADGDIEAYAKTLAQGAFQIPLKEGAAPVPQNTVRAAMPNAGANNDQNEGKELQAMLRAASQLTDEYEASKQKFEQWRGQTAKIVGEYHDIPGSYWRGRFGDTVALTPVPGATSAGPKRPEGLENRVQDEVRQLSQKAETSATFKYRMPWQVLSIFGAIVRQGNSFAVVVLEPKIFKWPYLLSDQRMFALLFSILALLGVGALNRYCIRPVQDLAARTEKLAIGRDLLPPGNVGPLAELNRLQDAIDDLAQQSRDSLQKMKELRTDELNRRAIERARLANKLHGGPLAFIKGLSSWSKVFEMYLEKVPADVEQIDSTLKYLWSE
nr:hypothetical protein [Schwartzia sp. (in: firmicutes)]